MRPFNVILAGVSGVAVTRPGDAATDGPDGRPWRASAFGIFGGLQVTDLYFCVFLVFLLFLFLCHLYSSLI